MLEAFVLETRVPRARSCCSQASLRFCKRFLSALVFQARPGGPYTFLVFQELLIWPPSLVGQTLGMGVQNPTFLWEGLVTTQGKAWPVASQSGWECRMLHRGALICS